MPEALYFSQKFIAAIVQRFQNIKSDSDGAHIKGPRDLKNEIQIITLPTELWTSWKTFLNKHTEGELIDPDMDKMFKEDRKFKLKQQTLKREFFKHCGHFTDRDFGVLAQHLIGATPGRTILYPKVSVARTRYLAPSNHSHADWVERRKRKKVILQDFMALNPDLHFTNEGGDVINDVWRQWKLRHRFTTTSWDFLLSASKADYFRRRLQNEAWSKRITDMQAQFPKVHSMLMQFLKLKYRTFRPRGGVQVRGVDIMNCSLERSTSFVYMERVLNFSVLDCRSVSRVKATETTAAIDPFLRCVEEKLEPAITTPNLWLFIVEDDDDRVATMKFAETRMPEFDIMHLTYIPSKAEMLNNVSTRGTAPNMPILFLFKRGNVYADEARWRMKGIYTTPQTCVYYTDPSKNNEGKWRLRPTELRMEFYVNILQDFAAASENILAVFTGRKFMLAAKVKIPDH